MSPYFVILLLMSTHLLTSFFISPFCYIVARPLLLVPLFLCFFSSCTIEFSGRSWQKPSTTVVIPLGLVAVAASNGGHQPSGRAAALSGHEDHYSKARYMILYIVSAEGSGPHLSMVAAEGRGPPGQHIAPACVEGVTIFVTASSVSFVDC